MSYITLLCRSQKLKWNKKIICLYKYDYSHPCTRKTLHKQQPHILFALSVVQDRISAFQEVRWLLRNLFSLILPSYIFPSMNSSSPRNCADIISWALLHPQKQAWAAFRRINYQRKLCATSLNNISLPFLFPRRPDESLLRSAEAGKS